MQEAVMRWFYIVVIVLIAAATLLFCVQNRDFATMSFLQFSIRAPLAILALVVYVLGAVTGGSLYALLRANRSGARSAMTRSAKLRTMPSIEFYVKRRRLLKDTS
jgi:lipopolysaccharide assembly protein A